MALNPTRRQAEIGFASVLLAAATWAFATAGTYTGSSGTYPRTLCVMLGIGAALVILRALLAKPVDDRPLLDHAGRFVLGFAMIFVYIVAIDLAGYILPSLAFGIGLPVLLGYTNFRLLVPVVIGTILLILLVFKVTLERPLPPDLLDPVMEAIL